VIREEGVYHIPPISHQSSSSGPSASRSLFRLPAILSVPTASCSRLPQAVPHLPCQVYPIVLQARSVRLAYREGSEREGCRIVGTKSYRSRCQCMQIFEDSLPGIFLLQVRDYSKQRSHCMELDETGDSLLTLLLDEPFVPIVFDS
jgi:hypothetical protein